MCLLVLAWKTRPDLRLLLAGNRDELHDRATAELDWWPDQKMIAGRDLVAGGTWLAASREGRFAVVTNVPRIAAPSGARSRGHLVKDFVTGAESPLEYLDSIAADRGRYAGFSMIAGDADTAAYYGSVEPEARLLDPGVYGLGNDVLDLPSPRLTRAVDAVGALLERSDHDPLTLFSMWSDDAGPDAPFRRGERYGTRCTTLVKRTVDEMTVAEVAYGRDGSAGAPRVFRWLTGS